MITIKNNNGLFLMRDGFQSFCYTEDANLAENFSTIEEAERIKKKLISHKGLVIVTPETEIFS